LVASQIKMSPMFIAVWDSGSFFLIRCPFFGELLFNQVGGAAWLMLGPFYFWVNIVQIKGTRTEVCANTTKTPRSTLRSQSSTHFLASFIICFSALFFVLRPTLGRGSQTSRKVRGSSLNCMWVPAFHKAVRGSWSAFTKIR
jgi:hypothetical protein